MKKKKLANKIDILGDLIDNENYTEAYALCKQIDDDFKNWVSADSDLSWFDRITLRGTYWLLKQMLKHESE